MLMQSQPESSSSPAPKGLESLNYELFERYERLSKNPDNISPDDLIEIADAFAAGKDPHRRYLAGSAYCEAVLNRGLVNTDYADYDTTMGHLGEAEGLLKAASIDFQYGIEAGKPDYIALLRCERQLMFIPLINNLYHNDVTDGVREDTWQDIQSHIRRTMVAAELLKEEIRAIDGELYSSRYKRYIEQRSDIRGHLYEMLTLAVLNFPYDNQRAAIPTFPHLDSGRHTPVLTHDLVLYRLTDEGIPTLPSIVEVKGTVHPEHIERHEKRIKVTSSLLVDVKWLFEIDTQNSLHDVVNVLLNPLEGDNPDQILAWRDLIIAGHNRYTPLEGMSSEPLKPPVLPSHALMTDIPEQQIAA